MKVRITIPFNIALSKNSKHDLFRGIPHVRKAFQKEVDGIALRLRGERNRQGLWFRDGVDTSVVIRVYRPNAKSDAQNFEEGICDAIQEGLGINDRYIKEKQTLSFVDPDNPRIEITVSQQDRAEGV